MKLKVRSPATFTPSNIGTGRRRESGRKEKNDISDTDAFLSLSRNTLSEGNEDLWTRIRAEFREEGLILKGRPGLLHGHSTVQEIKLR